MNDSNTFVQICGANLSKVKKALKNDQYRYDGVFPELNELIRKRKYVPILPQKATLLYLDKYIILIDIDFPNKVVRIDVYPNGREDIIYQIIWKPITNKYRFYCTLEHELSEQKGIPINYSQSLQQNLILSIDSIIQRNQRTADLLAQKIIEEVRLFFYMLENQSTYITKSNKKNPQKVIRLNELSKNYVVVREHSKNVGTTRVAPYLRRRRHSQ